MSLCSEFGSVVVGLPASFVPENSLTCYRDKIQNAASMQSFL